MKLRFPEPLESEFQRDHARKSSFTVRAGLLLGALLYGSLGFSAAEFRVKAGMGLFVSHQIVEKHGGRILIQSETGRGTAVTIELPREGAAADPRSVLAS